MAQSSIEWTELTWNPTTGCTKISQGCKFCYAEVMTRRLQSMGLTKYSDGFKKVRTHRDELKRPYSWRGRKVVFVNSMSDLFHERMSLSFIKDVFAVMNDLPQHTFQVLTKRGDILFKYHEELTWTSNIWMGVSVENDDVLERVDFLRQTNAKTKFLSCEPLIGSLSSLSLEGMDWVIVGGESGPKAREMKEEWVHEIRENCEINGVPFFFKQWGGRNKKKAGRVLNGKVWDEMPFQ